MNRLLKAVAALLCAVGLSASANAQMTTVTASSIKMKGVPVSTGTVTFIPTNASGNPIPITANGSLYDTQGITTAVTNGAIANGFQVPDECTASPALPNQVLNYTVQIYNSGTKTSFTLNGVKGVCGTTWALDSYVPTQNAAITTTGLISGTTVPAHCVNTSIFYKQASPSDTYNCVSGVYVLQTSSGGSSSPATDAAFGTVKLASGQTSTTLAKVATSGVYSDLSGTPTLGSAAAQNTSAFDAAGAATSAAAASVPLTQKAAANGVATLDANAKILSSQLYTSVAITSTGLLADYHFQDGTGTTVADSSGNGNNGTANANTTWVANGLDFADPASTTNKAAAVSLPAALNTTKTILMVVYEKPIQKTLMAGQFQLLVTSSLSTAGLNLTAGYVNSTGAFESGYSLSTYVSTSNTTAKNRFSGLHALEMVCGTGGSDKDHLYIDGTEVSYTNQGSSCGAQTSGNLYIGNAGVAPWTSSGQMSATAYRAAFWSTQHTAAQVKAESLAALSEVVSRGVAPVSQPVGVPTLFAVGDSITFGQGVATPWPSSLSLTNQPSWTIENWGIPSVSALTVSASEPNRIAPRCQSTSGYAPVSIVFMGTNDFNSTGGTAATAQVVWNSIASEINTLKNAGCKVFVGTMISRTGSGTNSQTNDANKNALDALIVSQSKTVGADGLIDFAANPNLGADNANSNTTYFQVDGTHPTLTGQGLLATAASNTLNYYFSQYGQGNPHIISATATLTSADAVVEISSPSGAVALTMPDCTGPTGATYVVSNPQSAQAVTIAGGASQPINGLSTAITIPANSTVRLTDVANPRSTSGCHWTM